MRMTADTVVAGSTVPKAIGPSLSSIGASIWLRCYRLSKSSGPTTIAPAVNRASFPKIRNSTSWTVPSGVRRMMGRVGAKEAFGGKGAAVSHSPEGTFSWVAIER